MVPSMSLLRKGQGEGYIEGFLRDSGIFHMLHCGHAPIGRAPMRKRIARDGTQENDILTGEESPECGWNRVASKLGW